MNPELCGAATRRGLAFAVCGAFAALALCLAVSGVVAQTLLGAVAVTASPAHVAVNLRVARVYPASQRPGGARQHVGRQ